MPKSPASAMRSTASAGRSTPKNLVTKDDQKQIARMLGRRFACQGKLPETDAAKILALAAQIRRGREKNPYQTDFTRFATEMAYTVDEGAAGRVALMPDWPYLRELDDALLRFSPMMIDKARRTLITWRICAADLWIVAGGQDPRWPALMPTPDNPNGGNRKVIIGSQFLEGEGSSQDFLARIKFMIDQIEERGLRDLWPGFPTFSGNLSRLTASNGGIVSAVPQGANKVRGSGITAIHSEELGFVDEARATVMQALQTLRPFGKFWGVTTANAASFAADIYHERLKDQGWSHESTD